LSGNEISNNKASRLEWWEVKANSTKIRYHENTVSDSRVYVKNNEH